MKYIKKFENKIEFEPDVVRFKINMLKFYGKNGMYPNIFNGGLKQETIKKYLSDFVRKRRETENWGGGDSFDREIFRDYLLFKLGYRKIGELEYKFNVKELLTDFEINTDKFNV